MFFYYANEDPTLPQARQVFGKYLNGGARGIGEQKFPIDFDSKAMQMVAEVAQEFRAPVMMRFEDHGRSKLLLNMYLERFHEPLLRYPGAVFFGHRQTWWANLDGNYRPGVIYTKGPVAPASLAVRLLSAGLGLNALLRGEGYAQQFLAQYQHKLTFGSNCSDYLGRGPKCTG